MKKKLLLILLLLILTCLAGCGAITIDVKGLSDYISTSASTSEGPGESLKTTLMENSKRLKSIYDTFEDLDKPLSVNSEFNLKGYFEAMQIRSEELADTKLIEANQPTVHGKEILDALSIDDYAVQTIADEIPMIIRDCLAARMTGNQNAQSSFMNFKATPTSSPTTTANAAESDLNRFLTLFGYKVESIELMTYMMNEYEILPSTKNKKNYVGYDTNDTNFMLNNEYNVIRYVSKASCTPDIMNGGSVDYGMHIFSLKYGDANYTCGQGATYDPYCITKVTEDGTEEGEKAIVSYSFTPPTSAKIDKAYTELQTVMDDNDGELSFDNFLDVVKDDPTLLYALMYDVGCVEACTTTQYYHYPSADTADNFTKYFPLIKIYNLKYDENGHKVLYAKDLNNADRLVADENHVMIYVVLGVNVKHIGTSNTSVDIRGLDNNITDSTTVPYSMLPSSYEIFSTYGRSDLANLNKTVTPQSIINVLKTHSNADVITLNTKLDLQMYKDMSMLDLGLYTGSTIMNDDTFKSVLNTSTGTPLKFDLLSNIDDSNALQVKKIPLYIGAKEIGKLEYYTYSDKITNNALATVVSTNGAKATDPLQKFKYYYDMTNNKAYLLYGLVDIAYISDITARNVDDSNTHIYSPGFKNSGMTYNLFNKKIYKLGNDNKASVFDKTAGIEIYSDTGSDISVTDRTTLVKRNKSAEFIITNNNTDLKNLSKGIQALNTPLVLKTYLEGLYLPGVAEDEIFACVGRRILFNSSWFDRNKTITEITPAFTLITPTAPNVEDESSVHTVGDLMSAQISTKTKSSTSPEDATTQVTKVYKGLTKLKYYEYEDVIRVEDSLSAYNRVNTFYNSIITAGEFKTNSSWLITDSARRFAKHCDGTQSKHGIMSPSILVWCTATDINNGLAVYLESSQFDSWKEWLLANGYENYLGDMEAEDYTTQLVHRIELTYDIILDATQGSSDIKINTDGLEVLDDWLHNKDGKTLSAIVDIGATIFGVALLFYGILLLALYIIDIGVVGEGDGLLKKATFNRMKSVTGMSKAERKQLTERSEKGTYTIRAVNFTDVFFVALIIWVVAVIILIGVSYDVVGKLLEIAEKITSVVKGTLKR